MRFSTASKDHGEEESCSPDADDYNENDGGDIEGLAAENAAVEEEDGEFGRAEGEALHPVERVEDLAFVR